MYEQLIQFLSSQAFENFLAGLALVISLVALIVSIRATKTANRLSIQPSLSVNYSHSSGWQIRNTGNGPAYEVVIRTELAADLLPDDAKIRELGQIDKGEQKILDWLGHINIRRMKVSYRDLKGHSYSEQVSIATKS